MQATMFVIQNLPEKQRFSPPTSRDYFKFCAIVLLGLSFFALMTYLTLKAETEERMVKQRMDKFMDPPHSPESGSRMIVRETLIRIIDFSEDPSD